jgi:tetratricopeptide (TPR) repeat protein
MNQGALLVGALVLGAVGGVVAGSVAGPAAAPSPRGPESGPASPDVSEALARLERRVEELAAAAAAKPAAPASNVTAAPPVGGMSPAAAAAASPGAEAAPAEDRVATLEARVVALEKRGAVAGPAVPEDLSKVPAAELESLARTLMQQQRSADWLRVAEEWAKRSDLTADQKVEAEMNIGWALRGLGKHAEAEARFRETLEHTDAASEKAPWLGFQIAWQRSYQKDFATASQDMEKAANHPAVGALLRVHSLYNAANFAKEAGDTNRARALLERMLTYADDIPASQQDMRRQAEATLKKLSGN